MPLYVFGSSDDLIEIEGDLREEFNGDVGVLSFSDGTELTVEYGNGKEPIWIFERTKEGRLTMTKHPAISEDEGPRRVGGHFDGMTAYSEIVVLEGDTRGITASWRQF